MKIDEYLIYILKIFSILYILYAVIEDFMGDAWMKILKKDYKKTTKVKPESIDDLWKLSLILSSGDTVGTKSIRTIDSDKKEKRPMYLRICAEDITFDEVTESLRIKGKITEGPDDISFGYHSFRIRENDIIDIDKDWRRYEIGKLEDSARSKSIKVLVLVADERRADFGEVRDNKIKMLGSIDSQGNGKMFETKDNKAFYADIMKMLDEYSGRYENIVIAGPGFTKGNLMELIKKNQNLSSRCSQAISSVTGETGVYEVLKRGFIDSIVKSSEISKETKEIEEFMGLLGKDSGYITYGIDEVRKAAGMGAVKKLLVSDSMIKRDDIQKIISVVEGSSGDIRVIGSSHEAGDKLIGLGGIICFLRFPIE